MRDRIWKYFERYPAAASMIILIVGVILAAVFVPRPYQRIGTDACIALFVAVYAWASTPLPKVGPGVRPTIRQEFKRTRQLFIRFSVIAAVMLIICVEYFAEPLSGVERYVIDIGAFLLMLAVVWPFIRKRFHCPSCGTNFKQARLAKVGRWTMDTRGAEDLWDRCPSCGVSFDEPSS
jgi:asparagine N-glycosylation enzyme membrane subunit Stt3